MDSLRAVRIGQNWAQSYHNVSKIALRDITIRCLTTVVISFKLYSFRLLTYRLSIKGSLPLANFFAGKFVMTRPWPTLHAKKVASKSNKWGFPTWRMFFGEITGLTVSKVPNLTDVFLLRSGLLPVCFFFLLIQPLRGISPCTTMLLVQGIGMEKYLDILPKRAVPQRQIDLSTEWIIFLWIT